jgi:Domain of unknown function (DUF1772)
MVPINKQHTAIFERVKDRENKNEEKELSTLQKRWSQLNYGRALVMLTGSVAGMMGLLLPHACIAVCCKHASSRLHIPLPQPAFRSVPEDRCRHRPNRRFPDPIKNALHCHQLAAPSRTRWQRRLRVHPIWALYKGTLYPFYDVKATAIGQKLVWLSSTLSHPTPLI